MKLLLVEDNPGDARLFNLMLLGESPPIELIHCESLNGALMIIEESRVTSSPFDAILLDLSLPDSQGVETFHRIHEVAPDIPIVILTALNDKIVASRLASLGAQDYLVKGFVEADLMIRSLHYAIERKKTEVGLKMVSKVFECMLEGIVMVDSDLLITHVNQAFINIMGYQAEEVIGRPVQMLLSERQENTFSMLWNILTTQGSWQGEVWQRRKSGEIFPSHLSASEVTRSKRESSRFVIVFSDISDIKLSEKRLHYLAHHDPLTGLPNRLFLNDRLEQAILHGKRQKTGVTVMFIDIDHFKQINDSMGHAAGDQLLRTTAERLVTSIRETDTVARLGGDEFAIILTDIHLTSDLETLAKKILDTVSQPVFLQELGLVNLSVSIGIASHRAELSADELLEKADTAMYVAKKSGRNQFRFFSPHLDSTDIQASKIEAETLQALDYQEYSLSYQPQFDLSSGKVIGVEALLRWQHPQHGLLQASDFISSLEDSGLIIPLGEWILTTACQEWKSWCARGQDPIKLAINLTYKQFNHDGFLVMVEKVLRQTGMEPCWLEFELARHIFTENRSRHFTVIQSLKNLGIRIAINGFDSGISSLNTLHQLKIDTLKVDRSLLTDLGHSKGNALYTRLILSLAQSFDLKSVAEGVENAQQLTFLSDHHCTEVQGFLLSHPLVAEDLFRLIEKQNKDSHLPSNPENSP
ncbi:two-component system response regulator [Ferrovum myxofaciens]|jgi:diguanylate cyclase (GGDEF)-like protein/PAS domain S-box-containing protein|uniref:two-component system response regulator n=1 Tax=Ferrovum myxofaciens TaxID=416213 RepID=UPI00068D5CC0|nr:EAL domain-containing protein [Ferrovum myxofaciens]